MILLGWQYLEGYNCYDGNGGAITGIKIENVDLAACIDSCRAVADCEGVAREKSNGDGPGKCWHKTQIQLHNCKSNADHFDLYKKPEVLMITSKLVANIGVSSQDQLTFLINKTKGSCIKKLPNLSRRLYYTGLRKMCMH